MEKRSFDPRPSGWLRLGALGADCPHARAPDLATCAACQAFAGIIADPQSGESFVICADADGEGARELVFIYELRPGIARAYGHQLPDGTWEGWLEFTDGEAELRTGCETTARDRLELYRWAADLARWGRRGLLLARETAVRRA